MKTTCALILFIPLALISCKTGDSTTPSAVKTAKEASLLLPGKKWIVKDVGLKPVDFGGEAKPDAPPAFDWFSVAKDLGEYETKAKESFGKASIELKKDSVASTEGLGLTGDQRYYITDEPEDDSPPGVRLKISGGSDLFKDMGITEATFTYWVLGVSEKKLLLQTPNEINNRKVVILLETM